MPYDTDNSRPIWVMPLATLLVGVLVGWLVIGWGVWPVTYNNALPQDLRAQERDTYLLMVAESFSSTGDLDLAQERLSTWPADQLISNLEYLQARLAEIDPTQAVQVQTLAGALGLRNPAVAPGEEETSTPSKLGAALKSVCTAGLWVLLVLAGVVALAYLWQRWRKAQGDTDGHPGSHFPGRPSPKRGSASPAAGIDVSAILAKLGLKRERRAPQRQRTAAGQPEAELYGDAEDETGTSADWTDEPNNSATASQPLFRRVGMAGAGSKVGEYRGVYQIGEPDYDEAFDISDDAGGHIGQCGLTLTGAIGRAPDQADAIEVWLWDPKDQATRSVTLVGEGAVRSAAVQSGIDGEIAPIRGGSQFEIESRMLLLKGTVERLEYAAQGASASVFAELHLLLEVYQKAV